jgi:hypothetical protein
MGKVFMMKTRNVVTRVCSSICESNDVCYEANSGSRKLVNEFGSIASLPDGLKITKKLTIGSIIFVKDNDCYWLEEIV